VILLIDNYDSFVHNLARYLRRLGQATRIVRNDALTPEDVRRLRPRALVLSPGPCTPREAGHSLDLVRELHVELPILGVCLGHQTIAAALGGRIIPAAEPVHGRSSEITHDRRGIFADVPSPLVAARYHSLVVDPASLPGELEVSARSEDGTIMAIRHRTLPVVGVQFHPESVLTSGGHELLAGFLKMAGCPQPAACWNLGDELSDADQPWGPLPPGPVTF
jgi:anthranilate synthase/aminodeoxychorismate synthase-like glutamine amidotransferase